MTTSDPAARSDGDRAEQTDTDWAERTGSDWAERYPPQFHVAVDYVVLTIRDDRLCVLLVRRAVAAEATTYALPGGFVGRDEELEEAAARELIEETSITIAPPFSEQLRTYGAVGRDDRGRVISVAYLAVTPDPGDPVSGTDAAAAVWVPVDRFLAGELRLEFDHDRILRDGLKRAGDKLEYTALATAFCPEEFTLPQLQSVYETIWGKRLNRRNFYRDVTDPRGFVEPVEGPGVQDTRKSHERGRPARLYRCRAAALPDGPATVLEYQPVRRTQRRR
jgi:8-oxo-dGTP diphosphatase